MWSQKCQLDLPALETAKIWRIKLATTKGRNLPWFPYKFSCDLYNSFWHSTLPAQGPLPGEAITSSPFCLSFFVVLVMPLWPLCFPLAISSQPSVFQPSGVPISLDEEWVGFCKKAFLPHIKAKITECPQQNPKPSRYSLKPKKGCYWKHFKN